MSVRNVYLFYLTEKEDVMTSAPHAASTVYTPLVIGIDIVKGRSIYDSMKSFSPEIIMCMVFSEPPENSMARFCLFVIEAVWSWKKTLPFLGDTSVSGEVVPSTDPLLFFIRNHPSYSAGYWVY